MTSVQLVEVGPRDGLQNEKTVLSVDQKIELIARSVAAGATRIEAVSFVNPKRVPQMAGAEDVMAGVERRDDVSYIGLVLNRRGLERAVAARVDEVNVVVVASEEFSRRNQNCSVAEAISTARDVIRDAGSAGLSTTVTIAAAFGCPFSGEVDSEYVGEILAQFAEDRPSEIALADTIGVGVPKQVRMLADVANKRAPAIPQRWHFHNTRNTGYANALTALDTGARALDASIGGFGGCPFAPAATGNIASEDLIYALDRSGVETGVRQQILVDAAAWLGTALDKGVPALLGRAGAFPSL